MFGDPCCLGSQGELPLSIYSLVHNIGHISYMGSLNYILTCDYGGMIALHATTKSREKSRWWMQIIRDKGYKCVSCDVTTNLFDTCTCTWYLLFANLQSIRLHGLVLKRYRVWFSSLDKPSSCSYMIHLLTLCCHEESTWQDKQDSNWRHYVYISRRASDKVRSLFTS